MKILVVDDDNIIRMGLCKIIKKMDDRNEIAGSFPNGKNALEYLMANYMEYLLLYYGMVLFIIRRFLRRQELLKRQQQKKTCGMLARK